MDFVTERLAIGNSTDGRNRSTIKKLGVGAMLNVAADLDLATVPGVEYAKVGLIDGPGNRPETLVAAVAVLEHLLARHEKVVVVCHEGTSRSACVVAQCLVSLGEEKSFKGAMALVTSGKGLFPNKALTECFVDTFEPKPKKVRRRDRETDAAPTADGSLDPEDDVEPEVSVDDRNPLG